MKSPSPLRYPGGKACLAEVLKTVIYDNRFQGCTYVEPFAGGVGAGLKLLREGHIDRLLINDFDSAIYAFWASVTKQTDALIRLIKETPVTIPEWRAQKATYKSGTRDRLKLGFAAFFLNRCNRSGIIKNAGPIGGIEQSGKWKLDVRFNREALIQQIEDIAGYGERIIVTNEEGISLLHRLNSHAGEGPKFLYADPPYYMKGRELYLSHFANEDHLRLSQAVRQLKCPWVLTYDSVSQTRALFPSEQVIPFDLRYSTHAASGLGGEIFVAPSTVTISEEARRLLFQTSGIRGVRKAIASEAGKFSSPPGQHHCLC